MNESQTPPVLDDLTGMERAVVDAARCGVLAEPNFVVGVEELAVTEDPDLRVRAVVIRELLMGRRGELDPRGLGVGGVRVVGQLDLDHVTAVTGLSLVNCALPDGVTCLFARLREIILRGSLVSALSAAGLRTDGHMSLQKAIMRGTGEQGVVQLPGAHIGSQLNLDGIEITNDTGPALHADRLYTGDHLYLRNATMRGAGARGTVRLPGAHIGSQLDLAHSEVANDTGPAISAAGLRTDGTLSLRGAVIRGTGEPGAVRLLGGRVTGQLRLDGSKVTNDNGPALYADGLRIDGHLFLRGATMRGAGEPGAVRLLGAHIGGQAHFTKAQLSNDSGPLLTLSEAQVEGALFLPASAVCPTGGSTDVTRRGCVDGGRQMVMRGLVFASLGDVSWRQWLHLLVHHTPAYSPQPYQQLAAVERAAGHDNNARHILITQQEDLRRRTPEALGGRIGRWRHSLWGWLGRYGYRAHRLVTALALALALAAGLGYTAGQVPTRPGHHAAERVPTPTVRPGTPCSPIELIGLGIDRGLPLGVTGLRVRCDLDTGTRWGQAFTCAIWALQALVWALATLAIAAYTGLVRQPPFAS